VVVVVVVVELAGWFDAHELRITAATAAEQNSANLFIIRN
jgi:hypothetical protein